MSKCPQCGGAMYGSQCIEIGCPPESTKPTPSRVNVRADMREQCAKLADKMAEAWRPVEVGFMGHQPNKRYRAGMRAGALELAALIRKLPAEI